MRVAHLTDAHFKDKFDAPAKHLKCLHHVQQQHPKLNLILNGSDVVFEMNKENIVIVND
ncbi:MAG: hypothetical protein ACOH2A_13850 [Sphingobacteriaceae bacterium]